MFLFETRNLVKTYGNTEGVVTPALRGVSVQVEAGEFLAIAGPSGSGKSTLLHLLGTLDAPSSGSVFFDGQDVSRLPAPESALLRLHHIGFIFQAYNLIPTLTALENVEYLMVLQHLPVEERRKKAKIVLERLGLGDFLNRFPSQLSGGQQQRVAAARALAAGPKVILADEPTANLDSHTAQDLLTLLQDINREHNTTFVFSTHDPLIMRFAQRVIYLRDGHIEKSD